MDEQFVCRNAGNQACLEQGKRSTDEGIGMGFDDTFSLLSIDNHAERMQIYHEMSVNYEEQKRMLHDYYNQIGCVQGLLKKRQYKEVEAYAEKLSDLFPGYMQSVDVNHPILNVVLNQK